MTKRVLQLFQGAQNLIRLGAGGICHSSELFYSDSIYREDTTCIKTTVSKVLHWSDLSIFPPLASTRCKMLLDMDHPPCVPIVFRQQSHMQSRSQ